MASGVGVAILLVVALNIGIYNPAVGILIPGYLSIITAVILIPLLTFFIVSIVTFLQLTTTNPRLASMVFTAIFIGVFFTSIFASQVAFKLDYSLIYLILIIVFIGLDAFLSRFLTKEKIILTSKA